MGGFVEASVQCPERKACGMGGGEDLQVAPAEAEAVQAVVFEKGEGLRRAGGGDPREALQLGEGGRAAGEVAAGEFADDDGMAGDLARVEALGEGGQAAAEVLHPDGGVREDHRAGGALRGRRGVARPGMVPPRAARRWAASRSMSASKPMRTRTDCCRRPTSFRASASKVSSISSVVCMAVTMRFAPLLRKLPFTKADTHPRPR